MITGNGAAAPRTTMEGAFFFQKHLALPQWLCVTFSFIIFIIILIFASSLPSAGSFKTFATDIDLVSPRSVF